MAFPVGVVIDSINLFLKYMYSGNLQAGETGKAPGQVFSAQGWYYNADGVRCDMSIDISSSPDANGAYAVFTAPDYVVFTNPSVSDMSTFNVTYYSGIAQLQTGQNFDWAVVYPGAWSQDYDILTFAMDVDSAQTNWRITAESGGLPIVGAGGFTGMKLNSDVPIITNNQTFIDNAQYYYNDWNFIDLTDIEYNQHYTYNEIMNIIIPAVQVYYPEISETDFISESEILETETETEPTESETGGCNCNINYDEILSEDELESILNQETYELAEIPTEQFESYLIESVPDMQQLPEEVVTTSANLVNYASQVITDSGLLPIYSPLAIFATFVYILRGCK